MPLLNPWRGLRGLPRALWAVFAATLVNRAGTMILPFLALYVTRERGATAGEAGLVLALFGLGSLVASPASGWLSDRISPLRVMEASLLASGIAALILPWAPGLAAFALATFLWAVLGEAFRSANLTATAALTTTKNRRAGFALIRLAANLGISVGPAVGGLLAVRSFPLLFIADGVTSILAGGALWWLVRRREEHSAEARAAAAEPPIGAPDAEAAAAAPDAGADHAAAATALRRPARAAIRDRRFALFLLSLLPVICVFFQIIGAMPLFLVGGLGLRESSYGLLYSLNTLIIVLLEVPITTALEAWPNRRGVILGSLLIGAGFGGFALASGFWTACLCVVVWTFGEVFLLPGLSAEVAELASPERRGEYMGLYQMVFSFAFAVGPWLGTAALAHFGPTALWTGTLAASLLSAAGVAIVTRPRPRPAPPATPATP